jgi:hypothetical protein
MTPEQTQLFDEAILVILDRNESSRGYGPTTIAHLLGEFGFGHKTPADVQKRLDYMNDPEIAFVAEVNKGQFHTAARTWKATARGINHLRSIGK